MLEKMENPEPFEMNDYFRRPDIQQRIDALLKRHNGQCDVIVGPRGTGKTTVVRKMAA
jgi:ABC-type polar amino acid transport system ATPase subunit